MKTDMRQRRPAFDREQGVLLAQALFHARGYDAVSIADLTQALEIVPPSLYAAYGSKLALFERALQSYVATDTLPVDEILSSEGSPSEVLTALFVAAAKHYTCDAVRRGCMVTEAMRSDDEKAAATAAKFSEYGSNIVREYVAAHAPIAEANRITDYVLLTLRGLSSYACLGYAQAKLVECSKIAGKALDAEFAAAAQKSK